MTCLLFSLWMVSLASSRFAFSYYIRTTIIIFVRQQAFLPSSAHNHRYAHLFFPFISTARFGTAIPGGFFFFLSLIQLIIHLLLSHIARCRTGSLIIPLSLLYVELSYYGFGRLYQSRYVVLPTLQLILLIDNLD